MEEDACRVDGGEKPVCKHRHRSNGLFFGRGCGQGCLQIREEELVDVGWWTSFDG